MSAALQNPPDLNPSRAIKTVHKIRGITSTQSLTSKNITKQLIEGLVGAVGVCHIKVHYQDSSIFLSTGGHVGMYKDEGVIKVFLNSFLK